MSDLILTASSLIWKVPNSTWKCIDCLHITRLKKNAWRIPYRGSLAPPFALITESGSSQQITYSNVSYVTYRGRNYLSLQFWALLVASSRHTCARRPSVVLGLDAAFIEELYTASFPDCDVDFCSRGSTSLLVFFLSSSALRICIQAFEGLYLGY